MPPPTPTPTTLLPFILTLPTHRSDRLLTLYSPLAPLSLVNPDAYTLNLTAWSSALTLAARAGLIPSTTSRLTIHFSPALLHALSHPTHGEPAGLETVAREMERSGEWIEVNTFLSEKGWVSGVGGGVWKALSWGVGLVLGEGKGPAEDEALSERDWVPVKAVEELAGDIARQYCSRSRKLDRVFTEAGFRQEVYYTHSLELSGVDVKVLAVCLARRLGLAGYDAGKGVLKFPGQTEEKAITGEDRTLLELKTTLESLEKSLDTLTEKHERLKAEARTYMAAAVPNKTRALAALKSAKIVEGNIKTQTDHSIKLEELLAGIEGAKGNLDMVKAMEVGGLLLKELNTSVGGIERVDVVMDMVREGMEEGKEVTDVLGGGVVVDEEEIEDELSEMIKEEEEKKMMEEDARLLRDRYKVEEEREKKLKEGDRAEEMVRELTNGMEELKVGKEKEREQLPAM